MLNIQSFARKLLVALAMVASAGAAQAGPMYHVDIDTHGYLGTSGFLDLYLQREAGAPTSTVTLTNFSGALGAAPAEVAQDVTGALPGVLVFGSTDGWNDYFQAVDFGGSFSFDLEFGGNFAHTESGITTLFGIGLYDAAQQQLGAGDVLKFILAPQVGGVAGGVTAVPEPSELALMVAGLAMLGFVSRRQAA
jgi:hypothetical protein